MDATMQEGVVVEKEYSALFPINCLFTVTSVYFFVTSAQLYSVRENEGVKNCVCIHILWWQLTAYDIAFIAASLLYIPHKCLLS